MAAAGGRPRRHAAFVGIGLVLLVVGVFGPTVGHDFTNFDDPYYVTNVAVVQRGLTGEGVKFALTTTDPNWHPLTWLSHMLDCQLFGLRPGGHHAVNVSIHAATAVLVFASFFSMTGALWRSAIVAALFAVHPLHVEPVAWIAERKELLAGLFWFAAVLAYARYARRPSRSRYALVVACFLLGLMSKPVLVTLPFALLLLDFWPLGRFATHPPARLLREKGPLLALSAASAVLTYAGQQRGGAMRFLSNVGLGDRLQNAVVSYAAYLADTVWPHSLAALYPYQRGLPLATILASALLLLAITLLAIRLLRPAPFLLSGWLWFLGVLIPMIGIVQVGGQARADRYTYIPLVGAFVMLVWGAGQLLDGVGHGRQLGAVLSAGSIGAMAIAASGQARYWKDSLTLMGRTVAVTGANPIAQNLLGVAFADEGRFAEAVPHYRESLRLAPGNPGELRDLGVALAQLQKPEEAAACFAEAVRLYPGDPEAHYGWGAVLMQLERLPEARGELEMALHLKVRPEYAARAFFQLGLIGAFQGDLQRAKQGFAGALRVQPDFPEARANLEKADAQLSQAGRTPKPALPRDRN